MQCKVLLAVNPHGAMVGLYASGTIAEADLNAGLYNAGLEWHEVLGKLVGTNGLRVWEGNVTLDDEGIGHYAKGSFRKLTPVEWQCVAAGRSPWR